MKKFIIMLIISCLIGLSCLAAVSAEDTSNITVADVENSNDMNVNIIEDNSASTGDDGSYEALYNKIFNGGSEIDLENNYTFGEEASEGINIDHNLIINGNGFTINANQKSNIFHIYSGVTVTLNNITFINSYSEYGAIFNQGKLNVNNCTFKNNTASYGGAITNYALMLIIYNSTFQDNKASNKGGAIHTFTDILVNGSNFFNNSAANGGAIYCEDNLKVSNSTFDCNCAISASKSDKAYGGAIYCAVLSECYNCTFKSNYVQSKSIFHGSFGGAIAIMKFGAFYIRNCYFIENKAIGKLWNGKGGAIYVDNKKSTLDLTNNYFKGNTATVKKGSNVYCKGKTVSSTNNYCDASDKVKYFYQGKAFHHKVTDGVISDYSKWKAALEESSPSENNANNNKVNDLPKINIGNVVKLHYLHPTTLSFSSISNMLVQSFTKLTNLVKFFI